MYTEITLDKPRRLRFDLSAFRTLEDAMGGQPVGLIVTQLSQLGITALCVALWAGLRHEDHKLSRRQVEQIVDRYMEDGGDVLDLTKQLNDAISESAVFRSLTGSEREEVEGNAPPEPVSQDRH